jgi:hypothetical protein
MERPACETDRLWPLYQTRLFAIVPSVGSRAALSSPFLLNGYRARILLALPSHTSDGLGVNVASGQWSDFRHSEVEVRQHSAMLTAGISARSLVQMTHYRLVVGSHNKDVS